MALIVFFGLFLDYCSASRTCTLRERAIHDHLEEVRIRTLCPMMDDVKTFADQDVLRTVSTVSPYSCNFFWCLNRLLQVLIVPQRSCYELSPAWPSVSLDLAPPFARTQKHCRPLTLGKIPGDDWIASPQLAKLSSKPPTTDWASVTCNSGQAHCVNDVKNVTQHRIVMPRNCAHLMKMTRSTQIDCCHAWLVDSTFQTSCENAGEGWLKMSHYSIYILGRYTLWLVSLNLLCTRTPHVLMLCPLTLRVTHPMTHQDLWVLHTGSESTKHSRRKPTH